jgi:acetoin utilization deacetylase AcuC-like enzyme
MGFCFFNHVAIAARHLRAHGVGRVAIVDWDVHHGNGTQSAFYHDPDVFFFSVHQSPHYPGTGQAHETGAGDGDGATLNVPIPAGHGDDEYSTILEERLRPALEKFRPDFLLLSAGFDGHHRDPLGDMELTRDGFALLTGQVLGMARDLCGGKLVSLLEGGYDLKATASSVQAHLEVLAVG